MTAVFDDYDKLRARVDKLKSDADRAAGELSGVTKRIKERFGCKTLKEAKALLKQKEAEEIRTTELYLRKKEEFLKEWGGALGGD